MPTCFILAGPDHAATDEFIFPISNKLRQSPVYRTSTGHLPEACTRPDRPEEQLHVSIITAGSTIHHIRPNCIRCSVSFPRTKLPSSLACSSKMLSRALKTWTNVLQSHTHAATSSFDDVDWHLSFKRRWTGLILLPTILLDHVFPPGAMSLPDFRIECHGIKGSGLFPMDLSGSFAILCLPMSNSAQLSGDMRHEAFSDMPRSQTEASQQRTGGRARARGRAQPPPLHMGPVPGYAGLQ